MAEDKKKGDIPQDISPLFQIIRLLIIEIFFYELLDNCSFFNSNLNFC